MHHPTDKITHTTAFGTPVVEHWLEREIARERKREREEEEEEEEEEELCFILDNTYSKQRNMYGIAKFNAKSV